MKRLLSLVAFFATLQASAQQVNPVPDYVFRNQMSVGRNAVTDTAAYFSIGPRYGATKGFMPPIVGDTASFSGSKRNGLLIFSVQKNKFLYWDSVRVQWSDMAGSSGAYIVAGDTASMLSPYVRHAGYGLTKSGQSFLVDTLNISTRAWRQKGLDSLAALEVSGSGTTNYVPKFTNSATLGNSSIYNHTNGRVSIGTTSDFGTDLFINGTIRSSGQGTFNATLSGSTTSDLIVSGYKSVTVGNFGVQNAASAGTFLAILPGAADNPVIIRADARTGDYPPMQLQTSEITRVHITKNGEVGIGTTSPSLSTLDVNGRIRARTVDSTSTAMNILYSDVNGVIKKANANFYVQGSGTTNYVSKFTSSGAVGNSQIFDDGSFVGINTTTNTGVRFEVNGNIRTGSISLNTSGQSQVLSTFFASATLGRNMYFGGGGFSSTKSGDSIHGSYNNSFGINALLNVTTGHRNSAFGSFTLIETTTGYNNAAFGGESLFYNVGGYNNTAVGFEAGKFTNSGGGNNTTNNSIYLGYDTRSFSNTSQNEIVIGSGGRGNGSNTTTIGNSSVVKTIFQYGETYLGDTTDAGNYRLQVTGNIYTTGSLSTGAPSGGTSKPWKLGEAATVSPTSPNRTIRVEIDGTVYYLHAKTTND